MKRNQLALLTVRRSNCEHNPSICGDVKGNCRSVPALIAKDPCPTCKKYRKEEDVVSEPPATPTIEPDSLASYTLSRVEKKVYSQMSGISVDKEMIKNLLRDISLGGHSGYSHDHVSIAFNQNEKTVSYFLSSTNPDIRPKFYRNVFQLADVDSNEDVRFYYNYLAKRGFLFRSVFLFF